MNQSYWINHHKPQPPLPSVSSDQHCGIAIIGAGLTGLSCAYYLSKVTTDVVVIEADHIGYGASGRNSGKITFQHGPLYHKLIEKYDRIFASKYYHAQKDAMDSIKTIIQTYHIPCHYEERDALLYTNDIASVSELKDEYQAYLDLEIPAEYIEAGEKPIMMQGGILVHQQAAFDPYSYCLGLADIIQKEGIPIYEKSPLIAIHKDDGFRLEVNGHSIHAKKVIFACQFPFIDHMHLYFARMKPQQETLLYADLQAPMSSTMLINIEKPLHSANPMDSGVLLTGNQHKSGHCKEEDEETYRKSVYQLYPIHEIKESWSSEDFFSLDDLPLVGKIDKEDSGLLFASGFNAWGNTTSNMAAKILCAYALEQYSTYAMLVSPQRKTFLSMPFLKENTKTILTLLKGKMKPVDFTYPIKKHATELDLDGHRYGAYRDEHDNLYIVDITCPHLGCTLNFNYIDKTWDCPCHGSRFSYQGEVIKGPAGLCLHPYGDGLNVIDPHEKKK